jgi:hypothetical protein
MPIWDPLVPVERGIQRGLARLPVPVSHWLGYRHKTEPPSRTWVVCVWGFIGAFCGLSVILAIFGHTDYMRSRAVPPIIASFVSFLFVFKKKKASTPIDKLTFISGRFGNPLLWRYRCAFLATTLSGLWPLLQWLGWCHRSNHLPVRPGERSLSTTAMARSCFGDSNCSRCYASDQDDPPTCWSNSTYAVCRPAHLGAAVVLPARLATVLDGRARYGSHGQQHSAAISQVLGRADSATATSAKS